MPILAMSALAVSVAVTSAVASLGAALEKSLSGDLRTWLGGDVSVVAFEPPNDEQSGLLRTLDQQGIASTTVITAAAVATADRSPDPAMLLVKFVDPCRYPLYGGVELSAAKNLSSVLNADSVVLSPDAAEALKIGVGDTIRIAGEPFRVASIVLREPDRLAGTPPIVGPHALLTLAGVARTGIGRSTFLHYRILFRFPHGSSVQTWRASIDSAFPDAEVLDYREPTQQASEILEKTLAFLREMSFLTLLLGAAASAAAMRIYISSKVDPIAILRTLGARNAQLLTVCGFQGGMLSVAACAAGLMGAVVVQGRLADSVRSLAPLTKQWLYEPRYVLAGALLALVSILSSVLPDLLTAVRVRPAVILRRDPWNRDHLPERRGAIESGAAVASCLLFGRWITGSWLPPAFVAGVLAAGVSAIYGIAAILFRLIPGYRHRSKAMLVVFAAAILIATCGVTGRESLAREVVRAFPHFDVNFIIPGVLRSERGALLEFIRKQPGVRADTQSISMAWLRLVSVDHRGVADLDRPSEHVNRMWLAGCTPGSADARTGALLELDSDIARRLGAHTGSDVQFRANGRILQAHVAATPDVPPMQRIWFGLRFDCSAFEGLNTSEYLLARIEPSKLQPLLRAVHSRFPRAPAILLSEVLLFVDDVARRTIEIIRVMSFLVIAAGILVLMAVLAAGQSSKAREIVILKTLGASRNKLIARASAEWSVTGLLASCIGAPLGCLAASVMLSILLQRRIFAFSWVAALASLPVAVLAANVAGWIGSYRLLSAKPMDILRE